MYCSNTICCSSKFFKSKLIPSTFSIDLSQLSFSMITSFFISEIGSIVSVLKRLSLFNFWIFIWSHRLSNHIFCNLKV